MKILRYSIVLVVVCLTGCDNPAIWTSFHSWMIQRNIARYNTQTGDFETIIRCDKPVYQDGE